MKKISIIGGTFYGNRGAEAMVSTVIAELRAASSEPLEFNVYSYYPEKDASLINDSQVQVHSATPSYLVLLLIPLAFVLAVFKLFRLGYIQTVFPASVRALNTSDVLICVAGVSFIDGREKFLPFNIATLFPAFLLSVPVIKFAQAVGPFKGSVNRLASRLFLSRCKQVFTRGAQTQKHLEAFVPDQTLYQRANDVAFLFKPAFGLLASECDFPGHLQAINGLKNAGRKVVGLCPSVVIEKRRSAKGYDYSQEMAELTGELINSGYAVVIFPNATRGSDMNKLHNNDLPLLEKIRQKLPEQHEEYYSCIAASVNAAEVHQLISELNLVITSRFHAMVGALSLSKPVVVMGWSHKYLEVMELFNQQDMVVDFTEFDSQLMVASIKKLDEQESDRSQQINNALEGVRVLSRVQIEYTNQLLKQSR